MSQAEDNGRKHAILLAGNSLQSSLLKDSIEQKVPLKIRLVSPEKLCEARDDSLGRDTEFVIIDYATIGRSDVARYIEVIEDVDRYTKEILLNAPKTLAHADMLKWQNLVGVFYDSDTIDTLVNGFSRILDGELWMSVSWFMNMCTSIVAGSVQKPALITPNLPSVSSKSLNCSVMVLPILR